MLIVSNRPRKLTAGEKQHKSSLLSEVPS